ncbi:unnamed protein product [Closterium sp. NIES-54]
MSTFSPLQPARHPLASPLAAPCAARLLPALLPEPPCCALPCWPPHRPALAVRRPPCPARFPSTRASLCLRAALLVARHPALPAMASLSVLTLDHEGRPIQFDTWLDDLQLYLLSYSRDSVSLFDHTSGASLAPPATADSATRSQWLTRDGAARLAVRNHLPLAERAHFGQHKTAKALYEAVVARYSSLATAALGRLILPYLFPELFAFATVEDLVSHLRTCDTRYRAALSAEFLDTNPPQMYITLYFIVTRLSDYLRAVRYHFLALNPTDLIVDLLEQHLLAAETSVVTVGATRGTPGTPSHTLFEGCSPSPLAPSYASATAIDILGTKDVRTASALSEKRRNSKGKAGKSGGGGRGGGGGGGSGGGGGGGGGGSGRSGGGGGGFGGGGGGSGGGGGGGGSGSSGGGSGGGRGGAAQRGGSGGGRRQQQQRRSETPTPQQLREWFAQRTRLRTGASEGSVRPMPPDPDIEAASLGASESALPGTAPAEALHTFMLDSGASRCFFRDSTPLTPLSAPVPDRLADPSRGQVLAHSSTVLSCTAVPSGSLSGLHLPLFSMNLVSTAALQDAIVTTATSGGQRVSLCTCTRTGRHLATLTRRSVLLQLRERFRQDLRVLRLHSDGGGEFSSDLLRKFCRGEGILQSFTLPASLQQNGIAERRIGLVMEVACTPMIHAAAPHFVWPFAVWSGALVSLFAIFPSSRAIPCVFLGFPPNAPGWKFYQPTSCCVLSSQDVKFDESDPLYHLFPCRTTPLPPLLLFLAPGPPPVDPLPPHSPAPSGVSQVDPLPGTVPAEVAVDLGSARGAASWGAEPASAEPGGAPTEGVEPGGAEFEGADSGGAERGGTEPEGAEPGGAEAEGAESGRAEPRGFVSAGETGDSVARGTGAGGTGATTGAAGPGGARTRGTGAAGAGGVGGARAGDPRAGDTGAGGAGAGGAGAGDPGAGGARAGGTDAGGTGAGGNGARGTGAEGARAEGAGGGDPGTKVAGAGDSAAGCQVNERE